MLIPATPCLGNEVVEHVKARIKRISFKFVKNVIIVIINYNLGQLNFNVVNR